MSHRKHPDSDMYTDPAFCERNREVQEIIDEGLANGHFESITRHGQTMYRITEAGLREHHAQGGHLLDPVDECPTCWVQA